MILRFTRTWLPAIVVLAGIVLWLIDPTVDTAEGSAGIIGAGLSIWLLNFLYRVGVTGDRERDEEDEARAFFDRHGHWPDEPKPRRAPRHRRPRD
jgi:hypothetical protein